MHEPRAITDREIQIARVLRPLGRTPLRREQAERAGQLLHVHWTTVYRLRRRLLRDPVTTSLVPNASGRLKEPHRLQGTVEEVVAAALERWLQGAQPSGALLTDHSPVPRP